MIRSVKIAVPLAALVIGSQVDAAVQWKASDGGNDHYYEAVLVPGGISWNDAAAAANASGGYLATPVNSAENEFIFSLVEDPKYWIPLSFPDRILGPYLGGFQPPGSAEPDGGWEWLNGDGGFGVEDFGTFRNWHAFEPNNLQEGGENVLQFFTLEGPPSSYWNDIKQFDPAEGIAYVIEWNSDPTVPEPNTLLLTVIGCLVVPFITRQRRRTNSN